MFIEVRNIDVSLGQSAKLAFKNLLDAHFHGYHYIYLDIPPEAIDIDSYRYVGEFGLAALYEIINAYSEVASIIDIINVRAIVDFSCSKATCSSNSSNSEVYIPFSKLTNPTRLQPTKLILEDEAESDFYVDMIRYNDSSNLFDMQNINFEVVHGGGSRTFREFDNRKRQIIPSLCIIDSDKKHPSARRGSTSAKFPSSNEEVDYWSKYLVLDCHEIENLVPLNLIAEIVQDELPILSANILSDLVNINNDYLSYSDLKEGIKISDAISIDQGRAPFWTSKRVLDAHVSNCPTCRINPLTEGLKNADCKGYLVPPLGTSVMLQVTRYLSTTNPRHIKSQLSNTNVDYLVAVLENIRDWCFARQRSDFT